MPLRGEGSCGGGGAPRDSAGSGTTEEGLTSRGGRNLRLPLRFGLRPHPQRLLHVAAGLQTCARPSLRAGLLTRTAFGNTEAHFACVSPEGVGQGEGQGLQGPARLQLGLDTGVCTLASGLLCSGEVLPEDHMKPRGEILALRSEMLHPPPQRAVVQELCAPGEATRGPVLPAPHPSWFLCTKPRVLQL